MTAPAGPCIHGPLATRVMRVRRETICPLCRAPIHVGQLIAKCGLWAHAACIIGHQHSTEEKP